VLGSLNWFNTATRPDLAVVCSLAGRVASNSHVKCRVVNIGGKIAHLGRDNRK